MDDTHQMRNIVEAALLTAGEPVAIGTLAKLFDPAPDTLTLQQLLAEIAPTGRAEASSWSRLPPAGASSASQPSSRILTASRRKSRRAIRAR